MNPMDPIIAVVKILYALFGEVKANGRRYDRLVQRVMDLDDRVAAEEGLRVNLESAKEVVKKYASATFFSRVVKVYSLGEEFDTLNTRLNDACQVAALQGHRLSAEATCREEDKEDRGSDRPELETRKTRLIGSYITMWSS
ncbi:hypothetical protein AAFF_G00379810 [Aldrovandia affinis]|uniref:Mixed lineage kinase domain-containing protein n=1 Tax=Aldrovandia affinis TaxID=143900 RepID=A0AAD7VZ20_9TELE|nr:hypothetical protein AAFF_G00379810 [Aldrovandia affinis]